VKAPLPVLLHVGLQGLAGYLVPTVILICGILLLVSPAQRLFYSVIGILLSLGTWLTSNLGGFVIGLLMGAIGSTLTFGWLPDQEPRRNRKDRARERAEQQQEQKHQSYELPA
jgi:hypothetical protein